MESRDWHKEKGGWYRNTLIQDKCLSNKEEFVIMHGSEEQGQSCNHTQPKAIFYMYFPQLKAPRKCVTFQGEIKGREPQSHHLNKTKQRTVSFICILGQKYRVGK